MKNNVEISEYRIAATEVVYILDYFSEEFKANIPTNFLKFLNEQAIPEYNPNFDFSHGLDRLELRNKTKALLAMIYRNYMCSEKEKVEYEKNLKQNENTYQIELREKYNPDNIFQKDKKEYNTLNNERDTVQLVKYKESKLIKFINWFKKLFNRK